MSKKQALGRGLGALIPDNLPGDDTDEGASGLRHVAVSRIRPNPMQPRNDLDLDGLQELADSIKVHGLIQPLLVTELDSGEYSLIAGERRWRAAKIAGLEEVPVVVKVASSQNRLELALVENLQRSDLNAIDEARGYEHLMSDFGMTQEDVARTVGKSRSAVANSVRLLKLPEQLLQAVAGGQISVAHARTLIPLPTPESQIVMMKTVISKGLSVRQLEAAVGKLLEAKRPRPKAPSRTDAMTLELEKQFRQALGTKVRIEKGKSGGKVIIHYYSDEELDAIYQSIVGPE